MSPAVEAILERSRPATEAWLRSCAGKQAFPSENAALAFAQFMHQGKLQDRKNLPRSEWEAVEAYCCLFCGEFHIGHCK